MCLTSGTIHYFKKRQRSEDFSKGRGVQLFTPSQFAAVPVELGTILFSKGQLEKKALPVLLDTFPKAKKKRKTAGVDDGEVQQLNWAITRAHNIFPHQEL